MAHKRKGNGGQSIHRLFKTTDSQERDRFPQKTLRNIQCFKQITLNSCTLQLDLTFFSFEKGSNASNSWVAYVVLTNLAILGVNRQYIDSEPDTVYTIYRNRWYRNTIYLNVWFMLPFPEEITRTVLYFNFAVVSLLLYLNVIIHSLLYMYVRVLKYLNKEISITQKDKSVYICTAMLVHGIISLEDFQRSSRFILNFQARCSVSFASEDFIWSFPWQAPKKEILHFLQPDISFTRLLVCFQCLE